MLTVGQLIEHLKQFDTSLEVLVGEGEPETRLDLVYKDPDAPYVWIDGSHPGLERLFAPPIKDKKRISLR